MYAFFQSIRRRPTTRRGGQTLVEYVLILAVISVVCIGVFNALGARIVLVFSSIQSLLDTAQSSH